MKTNSSDVKKLDRKDLMEFSGGLGDRMLSGILSDSKT